MSDFINLQEAAERLRVKKITLLRAIKAGELEAIQIGRGYLLTEKALQNFVEKRTVGGTKEDAIRTS